MVDGDTISRTGPASTLPTTIEWLGGLGGVIDSGTNGVHFTRTNWSQLYASLSDWNWSTSRTLSRSKSLLFDAQATGDGRGTYFFDHGASGISEEYFSCNYYWEVPSAIISGGGGLQWKIRRGHFDVDVVDAQDPSWYTSSNRGGVALFLAVFNQDATHTPDTIVPGYHFLAGGPRPPENTWMRVETWTKVNSPAGTANGTWRLKITNLSTGATVCDETFTGLNFVGNSPAVSNLRYCVMQNFLGNSTIGGPDHGDAKIWMDDVYIASVASGSNAFVHAELCNNSVYASSTIRRACKVNSIAGTDWSVTLNGPLSVFGVSDLTGLYLALFDSSNTPTMRAV